MSEKTRPKLRFWHVILVAVTLLVIVSLLLLIVSTHLFAFGRVR